MIVGVYFNKRRSLANGCALAGGSMGQLLIPQLFRLLTDTYSFRGALLIYSSLILHSVVGASLFRPFSFYTKRNNKPTAFVTATEELVQVVEVDCDMKEQEQKCEDCECSKDVNVQERNKNKDPKNDNINEKYSPLHTEKVHSMPCVVNDLQVRSRSSYRQMSNCECECHQSTLDKSKHFYTSTGSLYFQPMQDPNVSLSQSLPDTKPKDSLWDAIRASFCRCDKTNTATPLFDWDMLRNWMFIFYTFGLCVGNAGYVNTVLFVPPFAEEIGLDKKDAALLLSIGGVSDLMGRIMGGWFADLGIFKRNNIIGASIAITSLGTIICPFFPSFSSLVVLVVITGYFGGTYIALMAVVLVDYVGLQKMPRAFGLTVMFMGLANMGTPTLLGETILK